MLYIRYWWFFLSQGNRWTKYLAHPKRNGGQNLAYWCLRLWSLWTAFTCCCLLSWQPILLRSELVDSCFIHCHMSTPKLLFVALKLLRTELCIGDALLFLIDYEQTQHPLWTQISHWQMFMQKGKFTAFWCLQLLCYLTKLQFTIDLNEFVEFFCCFPEQLPNLDDLSVQHHLCLYNQVQSLHIIS